MTQVAVKLPDSLVGAIDQLVEQGAYANRSVAIRRALEALLRNERRRAIDGAFARGFAAHPETDAELADARRLAIESIEDEPWEKWW